VNNGKYNAINVIHHVIIPKANHPIALQFQVFSSFLIIFFLLQMMAPIKFNDKPGFWRTKIGDVVANSMLTAKLTPN